MDVSILSKNSIKIKGKKAAFIVGAPMEKGGLEFSIKNKVAADAVLLLNRTGIFDTSKIEEQRVVIKGPGDYEISGAKVSALNTNNDLVYIIHIDGIDALLGSTDAVKRIKEKINEQKVAILYSNSEIDQSLITAIEPKAAVFFGEKAEECLKALGKEIKPVAKFSVSADKMPAEMEIALLE